MGRQRITALQARILNRFYTSKFRAYEYPFPENLFRGKSPIQTRWREADLIENLGIKGEKDKDYFIESFYDLVGRGYIKEDRGAFGSYFMSARGVRAIRDLRKGKIGRLEGKYTAEREKKDKRKEDGGLEKIAASVLIIFGFSLIFQKIFLTGAVISTSIYSNGQIFSGVVLILFGIILFRIIKR